MKDRDKRKKCFVLSPSRHLALALSPVRPLDSRLNEALNEISKEIQAIIRQITASVTFLPLLDEPCERGRERRKEPGGLD